jgi:hypothetical protein
MLQVGLHGTCGCSSLKQGKCPGPAALPRRQPVHGTTMIKLSLDNLVVTSYETLPADGGDGLLQKNTYNCPAVPDTQFVGCQTYNCSGDPACTTGGGYAC